MSKRELKSPGIHNLVRDIEPMPGHVREALRARGLEEKYAARPAYQRNDYLMWINHAKREETKQKRLAKMLDELESGGVYMKMKWNG